MTREKASAQQTINTIRRKTQRKHAAEEKIRIVLEGLRGEVSVAELCRRASLTLTTIHPDGQHWRPSRHIQLDDRDGLKTALLQIDRANGCGWGAYFAVGLRRAGLDRWRRGCLEDVVALPALYVDVDDHSDKALVRLQGAQPAPSCLIDSGGGYHAYWWLEAPTTDFDQARFILRGLSQALRGDSLSIAQSMRLVDSINTKPERNGSRCHLLELRDQRYAMSAFTPYVLRPPPALARKAEHRPAFGSNAIFEIADELIRRGYQRRGDWLNGACPFPEHHKHGDLHPSFGFNLRTGNGHCYVRGPIPLDDLRDVFGVKHIA